MPIKTGVNPPKTPVTEGSDDVAPSSVPGIYKMPGPPAPFLPTPIPNLGKSSDNISGATSTVKIEEKQVAKKGTTFKSTGSPDAASKGTGGGVVSSTEEGTTEFAAPGSMNVKAEGENIQLLGDAMTNDDKNGGLTLPGNVQGPLPPAVVVLQDMVDQCNASVSPTDANGNKKSCTKLGADKHACVDAKIADHQAANPPKGAPPIDGEQGYKRPALNPDNSPIRPCAPPSPTGMNRVDAIRSAIAALKPGEAIGKAFGKALGGNCYPDAAIINPDGSKTFVDFKFPCPPGHPSGKGTSKGGVNTAMSPAQQGSYDSLGLGTGNGEALTISPTL